MIAGRICTNSTQTVTAGHRNVCRLSATGLLQSRFSATPIEIELHTDMGTQVHETHIQLTRINATVWSKANRIYRTINSNPKYALRFFAK